MRAARTAWTVSGTRSPRGSSRSASRRSAVARSPRSISVPSELLDEERVALGALDDQLADAAAELDAPAARRAARRVLAAEAPAESVAFERRAPAGPPVEQLRPRRRDQQQRPAHVAHEASSRSSSGLFRPVEVFDQHDGGPLRGELVEEVDPGVVQAVARGQRMEVARRRRGRASGRGSRVRRAARVTTSARIALEEPEMLLQHSPSGQ